MSSNKKGIFITSIVILIIISIVIFLFYTFFSNELSEVKQKQIINDFGEKLDSALLSYYDKYNSYPNPNNAFYLIDNPYDIKCDEVLISNDGKIYLNMCSIKNKKTTYTYGKKDVEKREVKEGFFKVYSYGGKNTLEKPSDDVIYEVYDFDLDNYSNNMFLLSDTSDFIVYYDQDNLVQMYNYKKRERALSHVEYKSVLPIKYNGVYDDEYVAVSVGKLWTFYNIKKGIRIAQELYSSVVHAKNNTTSNVIHDVDALSDSKVIVSNNSLSYSTTYYGMINYRNGNMVIPMEYEYFTFIDNYFYGRHKNKNESGMNVIHLFDNDGNIIMKTDYSKLEDIYAVIPNYIIAKNWGRLILVDYDGELLYDYGDIQYKDLKYMIPYKDGILFQFEKKYIENGNEDEKCISFYHDLSNNNVYQKSSYCDNKDF